MNKLAMQESVEMADDKRKASNPDVENRPKDTRSRSAWCSGYLVAILMQVGFSVGLRLLEHHFPIARFPIFFVLPTMAVAYFFGLGPALASFILGGFVFDYYYVEPLYTPFQFASTPQGWASMAAYWIGAFSVGSATILMRQSRHKVQLLLDDAASELDVRKRMEIRLREQTAILQEQAKIVDLAHVLVRNMNDEIVYWNAGAETMYGCPKDNALGRVSHDLLHTVFPKSPDEILSELHNTGHWQGELVHKKSDGTSIVVASHQVLHHDLDGNPIAILEVNNDITELKLAEEALRKAHAELQDFSEELTATNEELMSAGDELQREIRERKRAADALQQTQSYLENLLDYANAPIIVWDPCFKITRFNHAFEQLTGYRTKDVIGRELGILFPDDSRQESLSKIEETLSGKYWESVEIPIRRRDGAVRIVLWNSANIHDSSGFTIVATIAQGQDITERLELERRQEEIYHREHHIADMLQQALVPPSIDFELPGFKTAFNYKPALKEAEVGGDFYDIFDLGDGKFGILIGDVAGKGLKAAMRVAAARYSIRSYAFLDSSPASVLTLANTTLSKGSIDGGGMLTALLAIVDVNNSVITYASGGHVPPILRRADGRMEEFTTTGCPLGILGDLTYTEDKIDLQPGDTIVMVTDGITEARPHGTHFFGSKGLKRYLSESPEESADQIVEGLLNAAVEHAGGWLQDDAAIVVVEVNYQ